MVDTIWSIINEITRFNIQCIRSVQAWLEAFEVEGGFKEGPPC